MRSLGVSQLARERDASLRKHLIANLHVVANNGSIAERRRSLSAGDALAPRLGAREPFENVGPCGRMQGQSALAHVAGVVAVFLTDQIGIGSDKNAELADSRGALTVPDVDGIGVRSRGRSELAKATKNGALML